MASFILLTLVVVVVAALYVMRSRSVLYKSNPVPDGTAEPAFSLFNPFRDRGPERSAEAFLDLLKRSQCNEAVMRMSTSDERRAYICQKEREHVLESWRLKSREDEGQKTKLFFWHWRKDYDDGLHGRLWITVEKLNDQWQVIDYECWY